MSKMHIEIIKCPECGRENEYKYWDSINVSLDPELKESVLDGSIFEYKCTCGYMINLTHQFLYHDMKKKFMIQFSNPDEVEEVINSFEDVKNNSVINVDMMNQIRIVTDYYDLIEKIIIFDSNYNDKIIELIKCVYRRAFKDMNKDVKDFKILFYAPNLNSEHEEEHDFHLKLHNFEEGVYQIIPIEKSSFEKYSAYISAQEKNLVKNDYVIGQEWADSILDGVSSSKDGFYSLLDDEKSYQKEKNKKSVSDIDLKNIDEIGDDGHTLLCNAVITNDFDEVKTLLENGASPNTPMEENRTAMHYAMQYGSSIEIIDLLKDYGADLNVVARFKLKPLDLIDKRQPVSYLKHMFDIGAICNGEALLRSYASHAKDVECIKYLISKGFSLEARDKNDFNAVCEAICNNPYNSFLEQFLKIGGNPNEKYNGQPCLFTDVREYNDENRANGFYIARLKILFENGADINLTDNSSCTVMMYACKRCIRKEMIDFLLQYHPDLSLKDSEGKDVYNYLEENENLSEREKEIIRGNFISYENKLRN